MGTAYDRGNKESWYIFVRQGFKKLFFWGWNFFFIIQGGRQNFEGGNFRMADVSYLKIEELLRE